MGFYDVLCLPTAPVTELFMSKPQNMYNNTKNPLLLIERGAEKVTFLNHNTDC